MAAQTRRKAQTRRQLLDAAAEVVADKGFAAASLADIVERAGLTTGAIYSNFRSKAELLVELVDDQLEQVGIDFEPGDEPVAEHLIKAAIDSARWADSPQSRSLLVLQVELYLQALRDPSLLEDMHEANRAQTAQLARYLEEIEAAPEPGPVPSLEQVAETFFATLQGLQQHRLIFPASVPDEVFEWWARTLLRAAVQSGL